METWKEIPSYEGLYAISDCGNVKSIKKNKCLKPTLDIKGYPYVSLSKFGCEVKYKIHRLVANSFLENSNNYDQVDHINRIKTDNNVSNLRWANNSINAHNTLSRKNSTSKFKGVSLDSSAGLKKWKAIININKKVFHLGRFLTEEEAYEARCRFEKEHGVINNYRNY